MREIDRQLEQVLGLADRAHLAIAGGLNRSADDLTHIRARLVALSPAATLGRGYAIVQKADGSVVLSARQVQGGDPLIIRFAGDQVQATADSQ